MKVYVADFYRVNREHLVYNLSMLTILSTLPEVEEVCFYAHAGQIERLKKEHQFQDSSRVRLIPARVHEQIGGKHWIKKILLEFRNVIQLLHRSPPGSLIFFCSLSPITSLLFKLLKVFYRKQKVIITLHGDLDFIQQNKARLRNWLGKCFIWSFKVKDQETKYIILSEPIRENLIATGYLQPDEMYAINHPYVFDAHPAAKSLQQKSIRIGHIGLASVEKNTQLLFTLAETLQEEIRKQQLDFSIIGPSTDMEAYKNAWVRQEENTGMLSKASFNEKIAALDYVVFFYSDENYRFCSSGAILDAINHQIPILSLKNQGFEVIFRHAPGPIGYLCEDVEEMAKLLREKILAKEEQEKYREMQLNLGKLKDNYTLDQVRKQFLEQAKVFLYGK